MKIVHYLWDWLSDNSCWRWQTGIGTWSDWTTRWDAYWWAHISTGRVQYRHNAVRRQHKITEEWLQ